MNRDMRKQMKNILFLIIITIIGSNAFAFGGGGHGRVSSAYKSGVDAFGIHVNPDKPIDSPIFIDCDEQTETEIKGVCCANEKVYANGTKCCDKAGYEIKDDECQKICPTGLMPVGDECVNLCENYTPTECKPTCDWKTGQGKAGNEGNLCNNNQGHCINGACEDKVICPDDLFYYPNQNKCLWEIYCGGIENSSSIHEIDECILTCNEGYIFKAIDYEPKCVDIDTTCQSSSYASSHPCECDSTYAASHTCQCNGGYIVTGLAGCFTDIMSFYNPPDGNATYDEGTHIVSCINGTSPVDNHTNGEYPEYSCE